MDELQIGGTRSAPGEPATVAPARPRMLARARRTALVFLLAAFAVTALLGLLASILVVLVADRPSPGDRVPVVGWLAVAHLAVFAVLVVVARVMARMSTRFVEGVFRMEDRVMRAVAHEVRSPLTRLLVVAEEGLAHPHDPSATLDEVVQEAEQLTQLIDDLSESVRVMAGDAPVGRTVVRLDEAVAALPIRTPLGEAQIRVEAEPVTITGNPRLLRLAVTNLARNAVQHAYDRGPGAVVIRADKRGIAVIDDGPGMPSAQIDEVLADPRVGMPRRLSSLGLPLVNWVAEAHGGHLALINRPEGGLEARLDLPVDQRIQ